MITSQEPKVVKGNRYSVGETAKLLGVCRQSIHNFMERGELKCGYRRCNCRRFFLGEEILRFWRSQL